MKMNIYKKLLLVIAIVGVGAMFSDVKGQTGMMTGVGDVVHPGSISEAPMNNNYTSIIVYGSCTETDLITLRNIMCNSKNTLNYVNMNGVTTIVASTAFEGLFKDLTALATVSLPTSVVSSAVSFANTFNGCTSLTTLQNLDKYTNISSLENTFKNCAALSSITLPVNPANVANITGTFTGTKAECLKYLPTGVQTIPQVWESAGYGNFVLPVSVNVDPIVRLEIGDELSQIPMTITPSYAAYTLNKVTLDGKEVLNNREVTIADHNKVIKYYVYSEESKSEIIKQTTLQISEDYIIVNSGETYDLSIVNNTYTKVTVEAGGHLNVTEKSYIDTLVLKAGLTTYFDVNTLINENISAKVVEIRKEINKYELYFFSLPFDINFSTVKTDNAALGNYGKQWILFEYSENNVAMGNGDSWVYVDPATSALKANKGYIVTHASSSASQDVVFKISHSDYTEIAANPQSIDVDYTVNDSSKKSGWNLVSINGYKKGNYTLSVDGNNDIYVNIPREHGRNGYLQVHSSEYVFSPTESFFVQVGAAGEIGCSFSATPKSAPQAETGFSRNFYITIGNDTAPIMDKTTLIFNENAPRNEYYTLYDLDKKTVYEKEARIYISDHNTKLAFSAINPEEYSEVQVGVYAPAEGTYTLKMGDNILAWKEAGMEITLHDKWLDADVLVDNYEFETDSAGYIDDRFVLRMTKVITECEKIETTKSWTALSVDGTIVVDGLTVGKELFLYAANGTLIKMITIDEDREVIKDIPEGIYLLSSDGKVRKMVHK